MLQRGVVPWAETSSSLQWLGTLRERVLQRGGPILRPRSWRENKTLRAAGDDRLTGTRYDWLRHPAQEFSEDFRRSRL